VEPHSTPAGSRRPALERLEIDPEAAKHRPGARVDAGGQEPLRVNGSVVTAAALEEIGSHLVDLHGQHHQQSLIDPATHLGFLDGFAKLESRAETYHRSYRTWEGHRRPPAPGRGERAQGARAIRFLKFQAKELEKGPCAGEEERIESELKMQSSWRRSEPDCKPPCPSWKARKGTSGQPARLQKELLASAAPFPPTLSRRICGPGRGPDGLSDLRSAARIPLPQSADAARWTISTPSWP